MRGRIRAKVRFFPDTDNAFLYFTFSCLGYEAFRSFFSLAISVVAGYKAAKASSKAARSTARFLI